jgi:crossover junction endodeoxyribonuclease RusA
VLHCYRLELLRGDLDWITSNQRLHWRSRAERTKAWRQLAYGRAKEAGVPHLEQAHIECELRFADRRIRDPANWGPTAKAAVDGLVDAGVFTDDNHKIVVGPDMRVGPVVPRHWQGMHLLIYPTENQVKITGEYKRCPDCKRPYLPRYPRGTDYTINRPNRFTVQLTPHEPTCKWAADDGA